MRVAEEAVPTRRHEESRLNDGTDGGGRPPQRPPTPGPAHAPKVASRVLKSGILGDPPGKGRPIRILTGRRDIVRTNDGGLRGDVARVPSLQVGVDGLRIVPPARMVHDARVELKVAPDGLQLELPHPPPAAAQSPLKVWVGSSWTRVRCAAGGSQRWRAAPSQMSSYTGGPHDLAKVSRRRTSSCTAGKPPSCRASADEREKSQPAGYGKGPTQSSRRAHHSEQLGSPNFRHSSSRSRSLASRETDASPAAYRIARCHWSPLESKEKEKDFGVKAAASMLWKRILPWTIASSAGSRRARSAATRRLDSIMRSWLSQSGSTM
jgi:hypothetical protein